MWFENEMNEKDKCSLTYISKTLVLLQQPWDVISKINFLPYYNDKSNSLICGT